MYITFVLIVSICWFWFSSSEPISNAMFLRLPIIVFTCPKFSSISVSRASLVILCKPVFVVCTNVFFFLLLTLNKRLCYLLCDVSTLRSGVRSFDHTLRLFVYYFAIVIAFPRAFIFFERRGSKHNVLTL